MTLKEKFKEIIIISFKEHRFLFFSIFLYSLLTIPFLLRYPLVWSDEGSLAEIAYYFSQEGVFRRPLLTGFLNYQDSSIHTMFLYTVFSSVPLFFSGVGIFQVRILSVFFGLLLLILFYLLLKKWQNKTFANIGVTLLLLNPLFVLSSRTARPEILVTLFSTLSLAFVIFASKNKKKIYFLLAGLMISLALLTHPNGIFIFIAYFLTLIVLHTHIKHICLFFLGFLLPIIPYTLWFITNKETFIPQFLGIFSDRIPLLSSLLLNAQQEILRWSTGIIIFISVSLGIFSLGFLLIKRKDLKVVYIPFLTLIFIFTFFEQGKSYIYLVLLLPFLCIFSSFFLYEFFQYFSIRKKYIIPIILITLIVLVYGGFFAFKISRAYSSSYDAYCQQIKSFIPNDNVIIADPLFWFCFPSGNLRDILTPAYIHNSLGNSFEQIFQQNNITYVILDPLSEDSLKYNKWGITIPHDYLLLIQRCNKLGEVYDAHYPDYSVSDRPTSIYQC